MRQVTIITPCYNEVAFIEDMLKSVEQQDYSSLLIEMIIVDGGSDDGTVELLSRLKSQYTFFRVLHNPKKIVPVSLNIGVSEASNELIIRMDVHAVYPKNYVSSLINAINSDDSIDNVGCCIDTQPADGRLISRVCAFLLSNKFVVGSSLFRTGIAKPRLVDTVPFGCFRKGLFEKIGYFDEDLIRNQDDEFNARIIKNGGKILLLNEPRIVYFARDSISKLSKMFFQYGLFKPLVNRKLGKASTIRQFFPMLMVMYTCLFLVLVVLKLQFIYPLILMIVAYLGLSIYLTFKFRSKCKDDSWLSCIYLILIGILSIHYSYGWGFIKGVFLVSIGNNFSRVIGISR